MRKITKKDIHQIKYCANITYHDITRDKMPNDGEDVRVMCIAAAVERLLRAEGINCDFEVEINGK
jgi:hypothetical protein